MSKFEKREGDIFNSSNEEKKGDESEKKKDGKEKIEETIEDQPESVKEAYEAAKDDIAKEEKIEDKTFLFTNSYYHNKILAFVEEEGKWKTRAFHYSGSDSQWKAFPGMSDGKNLKGNHYVQSCKLHKDVYKELNEIPVHRGLGLTVESFVPKEPKESFEGRYWEEFEFKEKERELKKEEWREFQKEAQEIFEDYEMLNHRSKGLLSPEGVLYEEVESAADEEKINIKDAIDQACEDNKAKDMLEEKSLHELEESSDNSTIDNLMEKYKDNVTSYIERKFQKSLPEDMMPDFSSEPIDSYTKEGSLHEDNIYIEEYKVENEEGDELVFAMAYGEGGRVYIDNIYDPRVGVSSYGTMNEIVNMGYLIYKPEDYIDQTCGIKRYYKISSASDKERYCDINLLWKENIPVIKEFKENLEREGKI